MAVVVLCLQFFHSQGHLIMMRTPVLWLPQSREAAGTHIHKDNAFLTLLWNVAGHYYANEQTSSLVNYGVCLHGSVRSEDSVESIQTGQGSC